MREALAAIVSGLSMLLWALSYMWVRRATDGRDVLVRFGRTLILPMVGVGAASLILRGGAAYPWLALLVCAGVLDAVALQRLKARRRSDQG